MRWLPVRSLFWRAFLTFWGAMAVIMVCGMMLTAAVAWYRVDSLDGLNPGNLTRDAAQIARREGAEACGAGSGPWTRAIRRSRSTSSTRRTATSSNAACRPAWTIGWPPSAPRPITA
ncbi:hypothetical protein WJ969_09735 [Achromobacter xylosoxidans]